LEPVLSSVFFWLMTPDELAVGDWATQAESHQPNAPED
jgi:hypothetical protein